MKEEFYINDSRWIRRARNKIAKDIEGMTDEEVVRYYNEGAAQFLKEMGVTIPFATSLRDRKE